MNKGHVSCVPIVITDSSRRLLLQFRDNTSGINNPHTWSFFGGQIDGDEGFWKCAIREIEEELGVKAEPHHFNLLDVIKKQDGGNRHILWYRPDIEWGDFKVREGAGAGFFKLRDALVLPLTRGTKEIMDLHLFRDIFGR